MTLLKIVTLVYGLLQTLDKVYRANNLGCLLCYQAKLSDLSIVFMIIYTSLIIGMVFALFLRILAHGTKSL
ncbi:MAG TPA: hypothetical protein DCZ10_05950 [Pelotomaculum sp.]|nr:hypothetical protein [Pelotomaculum sp.]